MVGVTQPQVNLVVLKYVLTVVVPVSGGKLINILHQVDVFPNDLTNNQMSAAFYAFSCILQTTYQVNCFGGNYNGNMGDGSTGIEISNPGAADNVEYASSDSTVTNAIYVTVGQSHACLLDIDGYAYCWGYNYYGQLGNGDNGSGSDQTRAVAVI